MFGVDWDCDTRNRMKKSEYGSTISDFNKIASTVFCSSLTFSLWCERGPVFSHLFTLIIVSRHSSWIAQERGERSRTDKSPLVNNQVQNTQKVSNPNKQFYGNNSYFKFKSIQYHWSAVILLDWILASYYLMIEKLIKHECVSGWSSGFQ